MLAKILSSGKSASLCFGWPLWCQTSTSQNAFSLYRLSGYIMKKPFLSNALGAIQIAVVCALIVGVVRVGTLVQPAANAPAPAQVALAQAEPASVNVAQVFGNYNGLVTLKCTFGGVYSDTFSTPTPQPAGTPAPADVGKIDLSLFLSQTNGTVSGYINIDRTIVFSAEHTIQATPMFITPVPGQPAPAAVALAIGPYVQGTFDGSTLSLQSDVVSMIVAGRTVQRQFRITGTLKPNDADSFTGEYRETVWGYTAQPITVLGVFTLSRSLGIQNASNTNNAAPQAVGDSATTRQGVAVTLNVLANDSDANGDPLVITSVSNPQHGTASTDGNKVSYTPSSTYVGVDTFSYFVSDGKGGTAVGSVNITVTDANGKSKYLFMPVLKRQ